MSFLEFVILGILFVQFYRKCPKELEDMADIWDQRDITIEITRRRLEKLRSHDSLR